MSPPRGSHQPLSSVSQPSTPVEEDIAQVSAWDDTSTLVSTKSKGKGKQRADDDDDDDDDDDSNTVNGDSVQRGPGEYPPMAEEDLESHKVAENLKRWETLEKQRRKKARDLRSSSRADSPSSSSGTFSVVDVSRRASQLWKGRRDRSSRSWTDSAHPHRVLEDVEESVPMDEAGPPSASSPPDTPRTSVADTPRSPADPFEASTENPFENPQYVEARQESGSILPTFLPTAKDVTKENGAAEPPIPQVKDTLPRKLRPPQPLGLPPPAKPPPNPRRTLPQRQELEESVEGTRKRWWTEWLCGCREDEADQAGHTNPME